MSGINRELGVKRSFRTKIEIFKYSALILVKSHFNFTNLEILQPILDDPWLVEIF